MDLKDYSTNGKYLRKAFSDYSLEKQKDLLQKYTLLMKNVKFNDDYDIDENIEKVKKLTPKERTIILCGVKYRLSYKRFYMLQLLLLQGKLDNTDYLDACFSRNHYTINQRTTTGNIKSFISKLKSDLKNSIVEHYTKAENSEDKNRTFIDGIVDKLIYYNMSYDKCIVKTSFVMQQRIQKL